ncbi:MAG: aldo/keto reductase, partial [Candidatus Hodarchaeales archaeon]
LSRYHINRAINDSLERLGMDHVDLYQIHRLDPRLPMEEILRNMNKLIEDNKVLHIGASSMFAWQFTKFLWIADKLGLEPFKTMQNHYNLVYREEEREMLPLCKDQGIGVITWSPLARGFLTGKYKRGIEPDSIRAKTDHYIRKRYFKEEDFDVIEAVSELATEKEVTMAQIALAWQFHKDTVTCPIVGVTRIEHLEEAVEALNIRLTSEDIRKLEAPYKPHPVIGHS